VSLVGQELLTLPEYNQNPYIEEEQTTQWPKEKVQKDKQRSTKHTYKTKDRVTRTPLKPGVNSGAPVIEYVLWTNQSCFSPNDDQSEP
jgi:hypothetical protein